MTMTVDEKVRKWAKNQKHFRLLRASRETGIPLGDLVEAVTVSDYELHRKGWRLKPEEPQKQKRLIRPAIAEVMKVIRMHCKEECDEITSDIILSSVDAGAREVRHSLRQLEKSGRIKSRRLGAMLAYSLANKASVGDNA